MITTPTFYRILVINWAISYKHTSSVSPLSRLQMPSQAKKRDFIVTCGIIKQIRTHFTKSLFAFFYSPPSTDHNLCNSQVSGEEEVSDKLNGRSP